MGNCCSASSSSSESLSPNTITRKHSRNIQIHNSQRTTTTTQRKSSASSTSTSSSVASSLHSHPSSHSTHHALLSLDSNIQLGSAPIASEKPITEATATTTAHSPHEIQLPSAPPLSIRSQLFASDQGQRFANSSSLTTPPQLLISTPSLCSPPQQPDHVNSSLFPPRASSSSSASDRDTAAAITATAITTSMSLGLADTAKPHELEKEAKAGRIGAATESKSGETAAADTSAKEHTVSAATGGSHQSDIEAMKATNPLARPRGEGTEKIPKSPEEMQQFMKEKMAIGQEHSSSTKVVSQEQKTGAKEDGSRTSGSSSPISNAKRRFQAAVKKVQPHAEYIYSLASDKLREVGASAKEVSEKVMSHDTTKAMMEETAHIAQSLGHRYVGSLQCIAGQFRALPVSLQIWYSFLFFMHWIAPLSYLGMPEAWLVFQYALFSYIVCHSLVHFTGARLAESIAWSHVVWIVPLLQLVITPGTESFVLGHPGWGYVIRTMYPADMFLYLIWLRTTIAITFAQLCFDVQTLYHSATNQSDMALDATMIPTSQHHGTIIQPTEDTLMPTKPTIVQVSQPTSKVHLTFEAPHMTTTDEHDAGVYKDEPRIKHEEHKQPITNESERKF